MDFVTMSNVSEERYYQMIARKTGALFVGAAKIGAILAGATDAQLEGIVKYASNMGRAFQIIDDVLGSFGDEKSTGKPTDGDIREGKKTLLLIRALERASSEQREMIDKLVGNPDITPDQVQQVRDIFEATGARESVVKTAEDLIEEAKEALSTVEPPLNPERIKQLVALAEMGVHRTK